MGAATEKRAKIEDLLREGAFTQALALAADSGQENLLWLLSEARGWHTQGLSREQKQLCTLVLERLPAHAEALHLLGYHAQSEGDFPRAEDFFRRALAADPDYAFSKLALSQLTMMQSEFQEGRDMYESRFAAVTEASGPDWRGLPIARWQGESLAGKRVYIWAEQGLGDIIMFAGFLPRLMAENPARVAFGMFPKLISLFARSFPGAEVEPIDFAGHHALAPVARAALPKIKQLAPQASVPFAMEPLQVAYDYVEKHGMFDFAAPLGDLLVHYMPAYIPARHKPYMQADAARVAGIRERFPGRRIGISWHTQNTREPMRNVPLEEWLPLLKIPGIRFVSLQHGVDAEEIRTFCAANGCAIEIPDIDFLQDAEGLAALVAAMDEVITIDNSNAHLAGALGVKTSLLLPKGHNYRWPDLNNDATLWYARVTTLRQEKTDDWADVIERLAAAFKGRGSVKGL